MEQGSSLLLIDRNLVIVDRISDSRLHVCILTIAISLIVRNDFSSTVFPHSDTRTLSSA